jgi:hypothetical protein
MNECICPAGMPAINCPIHGSLNKLMNSGNITYHANPACNSLGEIEKLKQRMDDFNIRGEEWIKLFKKINRERMIEIRDLQKQIHELRMNHFNVGLDNIK